MINDVDFRLLAPSAVCFVAALMTSLGTEATTSGARTRKAQEEYLRRYAYMGSASPDSRLGSLTNENDRFKMAIQSFQRMAGLTETGQIDLRTMEMMEKPRCGVPDQVGMGSVTRRRRRRRRRYAAQGSKWPKTAITYRINDFTPDLSQETTSSEIRKAFKFWSDVTPLTFAEVSPKSMPVDIDINFARGDHGDGSPFDGPGQTLAHAFFPQYEGDTHFDKDETWTSNSYRGTNLLQVAVHEFGHALGLSHSDVKGSIMAPFYKAYDPHVMLHSDDIAGITYIYGRKSIPTAPPTTPARWTRGPTARSTARLPTTTTRNAVVPSICYDPKLDAIIVINADIFVFKGAYYYQLNLDGIRTGYPRFIQNNWPRLPDNIDTAVYWTQDDRNLGCVYAFKGDTFWRYNVLTSYSTSSRTREYTFQLQSGYPKKIRDGFSGLPDNIDAAFIWSANGRPYFIKGGLYYRVTGSTVDVGYPRSRSAWKGLPTKVDSAIKFGSRTYFFSGSKYYRFNDVDLQVDSGYPLDIARVWYGCPIQQSKTSLSDKQDLESEEIDGDAQFTRTTSGARLHRPRLTAVMTSAIVIALLLFADSNRLH